MDLNFQHAFPKGILKFELSQGILKFELWGRGAKLLGQDTSGLNPDALPPHADILIFGPSGRRAPPRPNGPRLLARLRLAAAGCGWLRLPEHLDADACAHARGSELDTKRGATSHPLLRAPTGSESQSRHGNLCQDSRKE